MKRQHRQLVDLLEKMTDEELMRISPLLAQATRIRMPHPRQTDFLALTCEEALYGGAAGGGKTEALLMYLAQGVNVPGYSGVFFRRTYAQLSKSNDSPLMSNLAPVLRMRLINGDWSIVEDAVIKPHWLRYYEMTGEMIGAQDVNGKTIASFDGRDCQRFATIDTAGTSEQKAKEKKGKPASWSVVQIWDYWPKTKFLFLRYVWRKRVAWDGLKSGLLWRQN